MIGVIADDLTGAAELGALALRHGLRAEILLAGGRINPRADVVCLDTDSRPCAPAEAARRAAQAARRLRRAGAQRIYKKTDSVLRGQVAVEIAAILRGLGLRRVVLLAQNPSRGRLIRDGKYFVQGKPIHRTDFARDPAFPRTSSRVLDLLGSPLPGYPVRLCPPGKEAPEEGIIIAEAASSRDVEGWAAGLEPGTLAAGGAEFFGALISRWTGGRRVRRRLPARPARSVRSGKELFVSGSLSATSNRFVRKAGAAGAPVFSLPPELADGAKFTRKQAVALAWRVAGALAAGPRALLNVGLPPVRDPALAGKLSDYVARVAAEASRLAKPARIYAEGGATAVELVRQLGFTRLRMVGELAPGVAMLAAGRGRSPALIIKPGSYAWPDQVIGG